MIERAFVDRKCQRESVPGRIVFGLRRGHAGVGIALAAVVEPQQLAVAVDAIGIVDVVAGQEAQDRGRGGLDHRAELAVAKGLVADEVDLLHRGLGALGHDIDEVDAVVAAVDDLGYDADIVAAGMAVGFQDAADIALHQGALQRAARLGFDRRRQVCVLDLLVALERDLVEHRRFGQMHDQSFANAVDRDLVEQIGRQQRLERGVARGFVEAAVGRGMEIGAHRLGIDASIAFDGDNVARPGIDLARLRVAVCFRRDRRCHT